MKMALLSSYHFATAKLTPMAYNQKKIMFPNCMMREKKKKSYLSTPYSIVVHHLRACIQGRVVKPSRRHATTYRTLTQ